MSIKRVFVLIAVAFTLIGYHGESQAKEAYEFIAGLNYTSYDDYSDYNDYGLSAKLRYLRYTDGDSDMPHGFFVNLDLPIILPNIMVGYGLKFDGDYFVELGLGAYYGLIWGIGAGGFVGFGFHLTSNLYINVQAILTRYIAITPYIGYEF